MTAKGGVQYSKIAEIKGPLVVVDDVENAAYKINGETTYAIQFHPEVYHSTDGKQILENFLHGLVRMFR